MSTRRATRAASSIGRGPGPVSPSDIPSSAAPRRVSRRAGNQSLPAVATGRSTAYGDNTIAAPAVQGGPIVQDDVANILNKLVNPEYPPKAIVTKPAPVDPSPLLTPSVAASLSRSRAIIQGAANAPRSIFADESNIFVDANVSSSNVASSVPPVIPDAAQARLDLDRATAQRIASQNLGIANAQRGNSSRRLQIRAATRRVRSWLKTATATYWPALLWLLLPLLFYVVFCIFQFICSGGPTSVRDVLIQGNRGNQSQALTGVLDKINQRLTKLELDVSGIKSLLHLNSQTLQKLNATLPDQFIFKKDKDGKVIFPDEFWHALLEEIKNAHKTENENENERPNGGSEVPPRKWTLTEAYIKFTGGNKNKLDAYTLHYFRELFPNLLKENHIISKQEVIESIKETWTEHKESISKDMDVLKKQLDTAKDDIKNTKSRHSRSQKELSATVQEAVYNLIPKAQIEALVKANLGKPFSGPREVNHLSQATGAVIHAKHTTPTYAFPEQDVWFPKRWIRAARHNSVPTPNGPIAALMPWKEYGDSWCAPSPDKGGLPTSITVIMRHEVYPEHIIVEHLLTGSLEPRSAPKEMEVLAWIDDEERLQNLQALSQNQFPDSDMTTDPRGYVRIGTWRYDANSPQEVQKFRVGLDLKDLQIATKRVMIRALSNWGMGEVPFVCFYRLGLNGEVLNPPVLMTESD